jgi:hypothetical protein
MKLPFSLFLSNIKPRQIYYFVSDKLVGTIDPHYFICLAVDNELILLSCCTSQFEKRKKFIENRELPFSTLVWLKPTPDNGFKKDTYVDCNGYFDYSASEIERLYDEDKISYIGELSESDFYQILIGLRESPLIEEAVKKKLPVVD